MDISHNNTLTQNKPTNIEMIIAAITTVEKKIYSHCNS